MPPLVMPVQSQPDQIREVSDREFHGYNFWHDAKQVGNITPSFNASPGRIAVLFDALLNGIYRTAQQLPHSITGQQNIRNLDGSVAWDATSQNQSVVGERVMDFSSTLLMFMPTEALANAESKELQVNSGAGRKINPLQGNNNCAGCSIAGDATLKGNPASAIVHDVTSTNYFLK